MVIKPPKPGSGTGTDSELFRASVGPVKILSDDRHRPARPRPAAIPRRQQPPASGRGLNLPDAPGPAAPGFAENQFFARNGLQRKLLRRLTRGQLAVQAQVDLHGMTVARARSALEVFLDEARHYRYRCVLIIHGKGHGSRQRTPVIKGRLDRWLRLNNSVLAFCSAQPRDGGTGAVYVLLQSPRRPPPPPAGA